MLENLTTEQKERLDSLVKERDAVIKKLEKLNAFVYEGKHMTLSCDARYALEEQQGIMARYVDILNRRIDIFLRDCGNPITQPTVGTCG